MLPGIGRIGRMGPTASAKPYVFANAEAKALVARMSVAPSKERKALIDTLVGSLKTAGVWAKLDALYVLAAHDAQAARLNWTSSNYSLTANGTLTFTGDRGYASDGTTGYLAPGVAPNALSKFTLNSAHVGVWSRTDAVGNNDIGAASTLALNTWSATGNSIRGVINEGTFETYGAVGSSLGHFTYNRPDGSTKQAYRNGILVTSGARAVTSVTGNPIEIFRFGGSYSTRQLAATHFGGTLTADEHAALYAALLAFLQGVGAA